MNNTETIEYVHPENPDCFFKIEYSKEFDSILKERYRVDLKEEIELLAKEVFKPLS